MSSFILAAIATVVALVLLPVFLFLCVKLSVLGYLSAVKESKKEN